MLLSELGWNHAFAQRFSAFDSRQFVPARVAREQGHSFLVYSELGELSAETTGRLRHQAQSRADLPAVGDWVVIEPRPAERAAAIHAVLPRQSCFSRKDPGGTSDQQVVAANVDFVFLVSGLDDDFRPRRIERYVAVAWESGAVPIVVLNKADTCDNLDARIADVQTVAPGVRVHAISALNGLGLDQLDRYLLPGKTVALLGSSGVGKSTMINSLLGHTVQRTSQVSAFQSRGRHTTTHRELFILPSGALMIDSPGMKVLEIWSDDSAATLSETFDDVDALVARCRFSDCQHRTEPGCAIRSALEDGTLDHARYQNYLKLQRELAHLETRQNERAQHEHKQKWKKIHQLQKQIQAQHRRQGRR